MSQESTSGPSVGEATAWTRCSKAAGIAEVSFVTFPANPEARILSAKEAAEEAETVKALEALIADVRRYGEEFRRRRWAA